MDWPDQNAGRLGLLGTLPLELTLTFTLPVQALCRSYDYLERLADSAKGCEKIEKPGTFAIPNQQAGMPYATNVGQQFSEPASRKRKRSPKSVLPVTAMTRDDLSQKAAELSLKLSAVAQQLSMDPSEDRMYLLQMYPVTLERSARLNLAMLDYDASLLRAEQAYVDETTRVEEEWTTGKARVRERLLEGIEERRRKAREEKDGDGIGSDLAIDAQARPHITRKVKEKLAAAAGNVSPKPTTPLLQPNGNSLRIEDITTPFPLALSMVPLPPSATPAPPVGGRRKGKGVTQSQSLFSKGLPSYFHLTEAKEGEKDTDLGEIRKVSKRRRNIRG